MVVWIVSNRDGPGIYGVYASEDLAYKAVECTRWPHSVRVTINDFEVETEVLR